MIRITGVVSAVAAIVLAFVSLASNTHPAVPARSKEPWKTGYWLWSGAPPADAEFTPDILYVEVPSRRWPSKLPRAGEYVVVRRIEPNVRLTSELASQLADDYKAIVANASDGARITGLQIDYDCPTHKLKSYAEFLQQLHRELPQGARVSVTALLDWFKPSSSIARVLESVDEFVPQFYDTSPARLASGIAENIDASKWASVFNSYGVPYRIGVSSFGRIARRRIDHDGKQTVQYFRDAGPIDFAGRREFIRSTDTNSARELIVRYEVHEQIPDRPELLAGDVVEITFPTQASVRAAYDAARRFGDYAAGVVFFRWPTRAEALALAPDDVRGIIDREPLRADARLDVESSRCFERVCSDVNILPPGTQLSADRAMSIRAIGPIELFIPGGQLRVRRVGSVMTVNIPSYSGLQKIYLGRAISTGPVRFEVTTP